MSTRSRSGRALPGLVVTPRSFGWDRALVATLQHVSLPFGESFATVPLSGMGFGSRERVSLLAQFAAHQSLLQFAGIADGELDPAEWGVIRKRGADVRLIRMSARACDPTVAPPPLAIAQQFAELVGTNLEVLSQPWARPDAVYAEAFERLVRDISTDLRWVRRSATGAVISPGPDGMRMLTERPGRYRYEDPQLPGAIERFVTLHGGVRLSILRGTSPLDRYSALGNLVLDRTAEPPAVAAAIAARTSGTPHVFVAIDEESFDASSREVVGILADAALGTWLLPGRAADVPRRREFIIAPRLVLADELRGRLQNEQLESFVEGAGFGPYLHRGELPVGRSPIPLLLEPARSYLSALALLGSRIERDRAERYLAEFLFTGSIDELMITGVIESQDNHLCFASEAVRDSVVDLVPPSSRAAISRVAAAHATGIRAALLWLDAGDAARASEELEKVRWPTAEQTIRELGQIPRSLLSAEVKRRFARALIDSGRYREAAEIAAGDEALLALAERRRGDYATALSRLERAAPSFDAMLLRAEVLRLLDHNAEALTMIAKCTPSSAEEAVRLDYERGLLGLPAEIPADHYFAARLQTYRALEDGDHAGAIAAALDSHGRARCLTERIDASLDRLFARFSSGDWSSARNGAVEALREVEETDGDRAAGGILFMLAYLAADEGHWAQANRTIERLRAFYASTHDPLRLGELDLLRAHLHFCRGRFDEASPAAHAIFDQRQHHDQIREAAALILDEIDLLAGTLQTPRSNGRSGNAELTRRYLDLLERKKSPDAPASLSGRVSDGPVSVPMRLREFRAALARQDEAMAAMIARELDLVYEPAPSAAEFELRILRTAAVREFPFAPHDFDVRWSFATRNRLGQWSSIGAFSPLRDELDGVRERQGDWIVCSEREVLFLDGCREWSEAGRRAAGALFSSRAEVWRLRRLVDQDETVREAKSSGIDGILGQSAAIREIESMVIRVAGREVAVCILGESGTGKELVARAIHRHSPRRQKVFTAVNCAALPETLIESELFGHVRGAFTGADRDRAGLIEASDGGTLFLDEVGELPLTAQAKLLRFLQEGEFRRVGDSANRNADVRIVSATNRRLEAAVEEGRFREDLYYRVRGVEMTLPPLRERGADVLLIARHFLAVEHQKHRSGPASLSPDTEAVFSTYRWPGNVRELQNTIRAAHALAGEARQIEIEHLPERLRSVIPARTAAGSYQDAVARFKRELIERSLVEAKGNQNQAASLLRMSRQSLAYQIRELGILVHA